MKRSLLALATGLLAVAAARADLAVPPPPGKKFVKVEILLTTDKAHADYEFYVSSGIAVKKVEFGPDAPVKFTAPRFRPGGGTPAPFYAVPKGAGAEFPTEKALTDALRAGKVAGQASVKQGLPYQATLDAKDPRTAVVEAYAVEKIDAKAGIVLRAAKAKDAPAPGSSDKNAPDDEATELTDEAAPAAYAPRGGAVVAGLAAALALAFTGLWLARRSRP